MYSPGTRPAGRRLTPLLAALLLLVPVPAAAQDSLRFAGFTRPGMPGDSPLQDGKGIPALTDPELRKQAFGGTVYYLVLELKGTPGDAWGSGLERFNERFQAGIDFGGAVSPDLDTNAKYIYLYQVVNDRGTEGILESASVRLLVDHKAITSWGYFQGVGLATGGEAVAGKAKVPVQPVSYSHILGADRMYLKRAPAVPVGERYRLVRVPTQQGEKDPARGGARQPVTVVWNALDPAHNPDFVMLLAGADFEEGLSFRAAWAGPNRLNKDARSTVFGFTSNLPPTLEPVKLRARGLVEKGQVQAARAGDDAALVAEGTVPTPAPEVPELGLGVPTVGGGTGFPALPPAGLPVAGGSPAASGGGGGPLGAAAPNTGGGGAVGGGSSGSSGSVAAEEGAKAEGGTITEGQNIFFNPTMTNLQQQLQGQGQLQLQQQSAGNCCCIPGEGGNGGPPGEVIPEPAALLLAALGLPFLLIARRRASSRGAGW